MRPTHEGLMTRCHGQLVTKVYYQDHSLDTASTQMYTNRDTRLPLTHIYTYARTHIQIEIEDYQKITGTHSYTNHSFETPTNQESFSEQFPMILNQHMYTKHIHILFEVTVIQLFFHLFFIIRSLCKCVITVV